MKDEEQETRSFEGRCEIGVAHHWGYELLICGKGWVENHDVSSATVENETCFQISLHSEACRKQILSD